MRSYTSEKAMAIRMMPILLLGIHVCRSNLEFVTSWK